MSAMKLMKAGFYACKGRENSDHLADCYKDSFGLTPYRINYVQYTEKSPNYEKTTKSQKPQR
jgi:hypothetical protein